MDNLKPFPEHERREEVASVEVVLPRDVVRALPVRSPQRDVIAPISVQWECKNRQKVCLKVHMNVFTNFKERYFYFSVKLIGIPLHANLWVRGAFSSVARSWLDVADMRTPPPVAAPIGWLRADGNLAKFLFGYTQEIKGTVTVYGPPTPTASPSSPPISSGKDLGCHIRELAALADVTLRAAGKDFPAHKIVLAARSAVFLAMFTGSFKEAKEQVVDITVNCSAEVFGVFVDFFYSGVLGERNCANLIQLLELGEEFMVEDLKEQCVHFLLAMGPTDAVAVYGASLEKPAFPDEVSAKAVDIIVKHWPVVSNSDGWKAFSAAHSEAAKTLQMVVALRT